MHRSGRAIVITPNGEQKSFFASLFDFQFTSFITLRFLKVIYAVLVAVILLGGVVFLIAGLASGTASGVLVGLIVAPLATLFYLILARIYLEVIAMFFRIGDNTSLAVQLLGGNRPGQGQQYGYGQPWGAPAPGGPAGQPPASQYGPPPTGYRQPPAGYEQPPSGYGQQAPPPADPYGQQGWGPTPPQE